jgi:hypothetical protein
MTRGRWERLLYATALGFALTGWVRWRRALPAIPPASSVSLAAPAAVTTVPAARLAAAVEATSRENPFRLDRTPAPLTTGQPPGLGSFVGPGLPSYSTLGRTTTPAGMYPPPGVSSLADAGLRVNGISGPPWEAILEGVPGRTGAVVAREGDRFGDLRVRSISSERVVIQGRDSTLRLNIKRVGP